VSIEGSTMIPVAMVPIGTVPSNLLRDYFSMLLPLHTIPLSAISSFYTEHQKFPFAVQPWEDFQSNRKTLAVVGSCTVLPPPILTPPSTFSPMPASPSPLPSSIVVSPSVLRKPKVVFFFQFLIFLATWIYFDWKVDMKVWMENLIVKGKNNKFEWKVRRNL